MKRSTNKIIIAGFPGVGKSKSAEILPEVVYGCESSDFHWNCGETNKLWPDNYTQFIETLAYETEGLSNYKDLVYICISTHSEVLTYLRRYHIPFVIVVPSDKDETIARCRERGNSESFINKLNENWDTWMENFKSYGMPIIRLKSGTYLSDILNPISTYDYLKEKIKDVEEHILSIEEDPNDDPMNEIINGLRDIKGESND